MRGKRCNQLELSRIVSACGDKVNRTHFHGPGNQGDTDSVFYMVNGFVALLRGINVSGKKVVPMAELRKLFLEAGYAGVSTYINSGNVVFNSDGEDPDAVRSDIEARLMKKFGFEVKVIVTTLPELRGYLSGCPYDEGLLKDGENIYITILSRRPGREESAGVESVDGKGDEHLLAGKAVYILVKGGYTKTVFSNSFLEKKLGVDATTRNINTLRKIAEIWEKAA